MTDFGQVLSSDELRRQFQIPLKQWRFGVTAPSPVTPGTTPEILAYRFANTNELISAFIQMPNNWDLTKDCDLDLAIQLVSGQTNLDELDVSLDYVVTVSEVTGQGISKVSSHLDSTLVVTTANGLAAGDMYTVAFTFDGVDAANAGANAFTGIPNAVGLGVELSMLNTDEVASFDLISASMVYTALR